MGDCYEIAGKYIMDNITLNPFLRLVHAEVAGKGPLDGVRFGHAWVLDGDEVIDKSNGLDVRMPKTLYYALGQIDYINNIHEYSWDEARDLIVDSETWGPWDLITESGL